MLSTVLVLEKLSEQVLLGQNSHNSQEQSSDSHPPKSGNTNDSVSSCQKASGNLNLSTLVHTSKQRALLTDMNADENMAMLKILMDELAEQEMDPNPLFEPVMPTLLSLLRIKIRTLSRDMHVPESGKAASDRCSNFSQFQASIALKVAAHTNSMVAQPILSPASSAQIPFGDTHNVISAKEQTSSHTTLTQSAWEDSIQVLVTRLLVALDWLQQQPSSQSASTAEPPQHALLHEALVSLIHKLLSEHLKDPMLDLRKVFRFGFLPSLQAWVYNPGYPPSEDLCFCFLGRLASDSQLLQCACKDTSNGLPGWQSRAILSLWQLICKFTLSPLCTHMYHVCQMCHVCQKASVDGSSNIVIAWQICI